MKKFTFILLFLLFASVLYSAVSASSQTNRTIAVLDFKNLSKNAGYDFLGKTISESLITSLQKSGKINLVERERLKNLIDEKKLVLTGLVDQDISAGKKIGTLLQADHLILGSYSSIDDRIEVNARLVNVQTGEILMAEKITEKMGDKLFSRISELGDAFLIKLMDFKSGYLNLDSSPQGADVKLDNEIVGTTPLTEKRMKAGRQTLTLVKEGFEIKTVDVNIIADQKNNYNFNLEKKVEVFPYKISLTVHPFQLMQKDYQPDLGISFEYLIGWFSIGVEYSGNLFFHTYTDTNAPAVNPFSETLSLYYNKFNALIKVHFIPQNRFISPYVGCGLGVYTTYSKELSYSNTAFYYKGIVGLTFFPASRFSVFAEIMYQNLGAFNLNEKHFNLFGDYTFTSTPVSLENFLIGLGLRISF